MSLVIKTLITSPNLTKYLFFTSQSSFQFQTEFRRQGLNPGPHFASKLGGKCDISHSTELTLGMCSFHFIITMRACQGSLRFKSRLGRRDILFISTLYIKQKVQKKTERRLKTPVSNDKSHPTGYRICSYLSSEKRGEKEQLPSIELAMQRSPN